MTEPDVERSVEYMRAYLAERAKLADEGDEDE